MIYYLIQNNKAQKNLRKAISFIFETKIMEYIVVKKTDANELIAEVNAWISKGWKPFCAVSIAFGR